MARQGLSGNTRLHVHRVIHLALTDAVRRGRIVNNPASRERLQAPRKDTYVIEPPSPEEVGKLIRAAKGTRIEVLIPLLAYTGLRLGEALGPRWRDVNLDDGVVHVRQVRKQRGGSEYGLPKTERSRRTFQSDQG